MYYNRLSLKNDRLSQAGGQEGRQRLYWSREEIIMKLSSFAYFAGFGIKTVLLRRQTPILGTIILTDLCNLNCRSRLWELSQI